MKKLVTAWVEFYTYVEVDEAKTDQDIISLAKKQASWNRTMNLSAKDFVVDSKN